MAQCDEQVFSGITSEHFATFLAKSEQLGMGGLSGQGNSGQASHSGITIRWNFSPEAKTLAVQCTESPMLLPCALINGKIKQAVAEGLKQAGVAGGVPDVLASQSTEDQA